MYLNAINCLTSTYKKTMANNKDANQYIMTNVFRHADNTQLQYETVNVYITYS